MSILSSFPKSAGSIIFSILLFITFFVVLPSAQDDQQDKPKSSTKKPDLKTGDDHLAYGKALQLEEKFDEAIPVFQKAMGLFQEKENWDKIAETVLSATKQCNCGAASKYNGPVLEASLEQLKPLLSDTSYWIGRLTVANGVYYKKAKKKHRDHFKAVKLIQKGIKILELHPHATEDIIAAKFVLAREIKYVSKDKIKGWEATKAALIDVARASRALDKDSPIRKEIHNYILAEIVNKSAAARALILEDRALFKADKNWADFINSSVMLGQAYITVQEYDSIQFLLREPIELLEKIDLPKESQYLCSRVYYLMGTCLREIGDLDTAIDYYQKTEQVANNNYIKLVLYHAMGMLFTQKNDLGKAALYFKNVQTLMSTEKNVALYGRLPHDLAWLEEQKNNLGKAKKLYEESHKKIVHVLQKGYDDDNGNILQSLIHTHHSLARINYKLEKPDSALKYLTINDQIHLQPSPAFPKGYSYNNYITSMWFGKLYTQKKDFEKAQQYLDRALEQISQFQSFLKYDLSQIYLARTENAIAAKQWEVALAEAQNAIQNLVSNYDTSDITALPDYNKTPFLRELWETVRLKTQIFQQQGNQELAFQNIQHTVEIIDALQKGFNGEDSKLFITQVTIPTYELAIDLAVELGRQEAAFLFAEKSKSVLLLSALKTGEAKQFGNIPEDLLEKELELARNLAVYEKQLIEAQSNYDTAKINISQPKILSIRNEIEALQGLFEKDYPQYFELKYAPQIASIKKTQAYIDDQTQILEYFVGDRNIYVFAIQKDQAKIIKMEKDAVLDRSIGQLYKSLKNISKINTDYDKILEQFGRRSYAVFQRFVEPVLAPNKNQLVIIPNGNLAHIPFEVLLKKPKRQAASSFNKLDYLINDYTINYQYSSSLMLYHHPQLSNNGKVLAMAASYDPEKEKLNPDNDDTRTGELRQLLGPIPGTKKEVNALEKEFQGTFLVDQDAHETNFRQFAEQDDYAIIHMAMHGLVDKQNPQFSSLALTNASKDSLVDDFLHAYEINLLQLKADLVVLSACETGYGKYERGEGVMSLGRGFMYAGAPAIIMTLWPLSDHSGPFLIEQLYDGLAKGLPKDQALRQAKLNYIKTSGKTTGHPFFWASFITLGDNSPISVAQRSFLTDYGWYIMGGVLVLLAGFYAFRRSRKQVA